MAVAAVLAVLAAVCVPPAAVAEGGDDGARGEVSLDARALVVGGTRRVLFAGEMHYTRSTPEVSARHGFGMSLLVLSFDSLRPSLLAARWLKGY
jgi:hypothetical protein